MGGSRGHVELHLWDTAIGSSLTTVTVRPSDICSSSEVRIPTVPADITKAQRYSYLDGTLEGISEEEQRRR